MNKKSLIPHAHKARSKTIVILWLCQLIMFSIQNIALAHNIGKANNLTKSQLANALNWTINPSLICGGYYKEDDLASLAKNPTPSHKAPITINADTSTISQTKPSTFIGNVVITQTNQQLSADEVTIIRDINGNLNSLKLNKNIQWHEPGKLLIAQQAKINIADRSGQLYNVIYKITFGKFIDPNSSLAQQLQSHPSTQTSSWGTAQSVVRDTSGIFNIYNGSYSSCPPLKQSWNLAAKTITLDKTTGRGIAKNAIFYFQKIPIFYTPYANFPLDKRRKSGLLFPSIGHDSKSGYSTNWPIYWNIAPNYDATITPHYMSKRGLQINSTFRYLSKNSHGDIHGSFLADDNEFARFKQKQLNIFPIGQPSRNRLANSNNNRNFISWLHNQQLNKHWSTHIYLNHASDDYYFTDFIADPAQTTENQLINEGTLHYNDEYWSFIGRLQGFQTLHPIDQAPVNNQYLKLPELILNGHFENILNNFQLNLNNSWVLFDKHKNPGASTIPVTGNRLDINPGLSFSKSWLNGYFTPKIELAATQYNLNHQITNQDQHITRTLPILSLNYKSSFKQNIQFRRQSYQQILEPHLLYLYIPYTNQNDIPLFDTSVQPFTFSQLFRTNRFNSIDRIGDANQLSYALTSKWLHKHSGEEHLRASIGQIIYFDNRRVIINSPTDDPVALVNENPNKTHVSPITTQIQFHLHPLWWFNADATWDPNHNAANNANLALRYKSDNKHIINVAYTYLRGGDQQNLNNPFSNKNDLSQADLSLVWPISKYISGLARWYYNINHAYTQSALAGLQYDSCCWAMRLIANKDFRKLEFDINQKPRPRYDYKFYLEFSLKTLGNIGNNPASLLTHTIPGYDNNFGKNI